MRKSTRATAMVTADFKSFTVYGYNTEAAFDGTASLGSAFMDKVAATKEENGTWTLAGGPYYWPLKGNMQFIAYSPATNVKTYAIGDPSGFPSFNYTIQDQQEDLLAAQTLNATKDGNAVQLSFSHILTQINFSAELEEGFAYTITGIKVIGVNNTGSFTYGTPKGAWTATSGTMDYEYAGNFAATAVENVVDLTTDTNALLLMPQTLPAGAKIEITYKSVATGGNQEVTFDGTKSVDMKDVVWAPGQNLRYKLVLPSDAQSISFSTLVEEWGEASNETQRPA